MYYLCAMQITAHLCIVVPCYQPSEEWGAVFAQKFGELKTQLQGMTSAIDLVLVNDGFTDNTPPAVLAQLPILIPEIKIVSYETNRGKGYALRQGVQNAQADIYLITDADFPYTMDSMAAIVAHLTKHGGIAAGNRDLGYYAHVPLFRRILSKGLRWMLLNLLRLQVTDSQCGLKGFDNAGKSIFLETKIERFLFDLEFLLLAKNRVTVTPVPVVLREGVVFSKVGWKILATEGRNFIRLFLKQWGLG
jgi:glycosyltransferase involved in cell wall biosynthesis